MTIGSASEYQMQHQVVLSFIFVQLFYTDCIVVIRHLDDGHRSDQNVGEE